MTYEPWVQDEEHYYGACDTRAKAADRYLDPTARLHTSQIKASAYRNRFDEKYVRQD